MAGPSIGGPTEMYTFRVQVVKGHIFRPRRSAILVSVTVSESDSGAGSCFSRLKVEKFDSFDTARSFSVQIHTGVGPDFIKSKF